MDMTVSLSEFVAFPHWHDFPLNGIAAIFNVDVLIVAYTKHRHKILVGIIYASAKWEFDCLFPRFHHQVLCTGLRELSELGSYCYDTRRERAVEWCRVPSCCQLLYHLLLPEYVSQTPDLGARSHTSLLHTVLAVGWRCDYGNWPVPLTPSLSWRGSRLLILYATRSLVAVSVYGSSNGKKFLHSSPTCVANYEYISHLLNS